MGLRSRVWLPQAVGGQCAGLSAFLTTDCFVLMAFE